MATKAGRKPGKREYQAKQFESLVGTPGFSEDMLRTHFDLYEGYVKHTNKCLQLLSAPGLDDYAAAELRRRLVWEFNGMRLHELYFGGMANGGAEVASDAPLQHALVKEHGSISAWWTRFGMVGATRGSGWALLSYDPVEGRLMHSWVNEHDKGALAGCAPILVLDLFEHAYMRDYNTDRGGYMRAFRRAIDWTVCEDRFRQARHATQAAAPTP